MCCSQVSTTPQQATLQQSTLQHRRVSWGILCRRNQNRESSRFLFSGLWTWWTKQSATNSDNAKCKNHYLKDVEKHLEKFPHLMGFKTEHTKPINSIVSELQRKILKNLDSNFNHHENLILCSGFKPQKYPTSIPVRKRFGKKGWFDGKVIKFWSNSNCRCYKILYKYGDKSNIDELDMEELVSKYDRAHHRDCTTSSDDGNDEASKGSSSDGAPVCSNTSLNNETNQSNQNQTSSDESSNDEENKTLEELAGCQPEIGEKAMKMTANVRLTSETNCTLSIGSRSDNRVKTILQNIWDKQTSTNTASWSWVFWCWQWLQQNLFALGRFRIAQPQKPKSTDLKEKTLFHFTFQDLPPTINHATKPRRNYSENTKLLEMDTSSVRDQY